MNTTPQKLMSRLALLRKTPGKALQTMRAKPDNLREVKCFCCEQMIDIDVAGKQFYSDFKGKLVCTVCDNDRLIGSAENLSEYFLTGFPKCCEKTMVWKTQYEMEGDLP